MSRHSWPVVALVIESMTAIKENKNYLSVAISA